MFVKINWTFPPNCVEIVSRDGSKVYRERVSLEDTEPFGNKEYAFKHDLKRKKWVRLEVWYLAANGAFSQLVRIE